MGNINNIWFLKDGGGSWAENKCELDTCYSIPYVVGDNYWFQIDIPEGFDINRWYLCTPDGTRIQELKAISDWKIISFSHPNTKRLIFKVGDGFLACGSAPCTRCYGTLFDTGNTSWAQDYIDGVNNVQVTFIDLVNMVNWDVTNILAPLPPGWTRINLFKFGVPCDIDFTEWNVQFVTDDPGGNHTQNWPLEILEEEVPGCGPSVDCWHVELPLLQEGVEVATLQTEPHHCPVCEPTVKLYGDYCLSNTDVFQELIFNTAGLGVAQEGSLTIARNDIRIQAVLKQLPSQTERNRNVRCNTFGSKVTQRYKLQGAFTDFPDYMVHVIESIFSAKKLFIEDDEYQPQGDAIFLERNVNGRSMKRLDVELTKCVKKITFDCSCEVVPIDCEVNPIVYDSIMFITPAPEQGYGIDRSIWRASIDTGALSGGAPPYTISNWGSSGPGTDSTFEPFDDAADHNFFRRDTGQYDPCLACFSVVCTITDQNGCTLVLGNSVDMDDLRCVEQDGDFTLVNTTTTTIEIGSVLPSTGQPYDYSFDGTSWLPSGQVTGGANFTITGLTPGTIYTIHLRVSCGGGQFGRIGPMSITTDP